MKKTIPLLILIIAILLLFCSSAMALEGKNGPYSYSVKKNGDLCITSFDWEAYGDEDVYIPKMIDGYSVTEIGPYAFSDKSIEAKNANIDDQKTYVGKKVVIIIPDTVSVIGEKAFFCTQITAMNIPSSVKTIGVGAFSGCQNLVQFSVDKKNEVFATINGVLYNKTKRELIAYPSGLEPSLGSDDGFVIPNGIESIAPYACYGSRFYHITFPSSLVTIGAHAFECCGLSGHFALSPSVNQIGEYCFAFTHNSLENITVDLQDTSIAIIPPYAFFNIELSKFDVMLPSNVERIEEHAFDNTDGKRIFRLGKLNIPKSVKYIGAYAFASHMLYISFEADSLLEEIAEGAFQDCALSSENSTLVLPNQLIKIGSNAFVLRESKDIDSGKYVKISTIVIPPSVTEIGDNICDRVKVFLEVENGSYAEFWATQNGYTIINSSGDDTSWLTDSSSNEEKEDTSWLDNN